MSLRKVKGIHKRLEYYDRKLKIFQAYVLKIKGWIKSDTKLLNKELKKLSQEDFDKFNRWYNG